MGAGAIRSFFQIFLGILLTALALGGCSNSSGPIPSPLSNLSTPKTILDRAVEARSAEDIASDTRIFFRANTLMLEAGIFSLATEVYERRLLVTGLTSETEKCASMRESLAAIEGLKDLYWHVLCVRREEQKSLGAIGDFRRALLRMKANLRLFGSVEVADVNVRVAIDAQRNALLLGRARSEAEREAAVKAAAADDGIKDVIAYIDVRP